MPAPLFWGGHVQRPSEGRKAALPVEKPVGETDPTVMALVARNGIWLTRSPATAVDPFSAQLNAAGSSASQVPVPFGYDGLVQAMASGEMRFAAASNVQLYASSSNVLIGAQGTSNVISVGSNAVTIHGNLRVLGTMDTISSSELHLVDKVIMLAVPEGSSAASATSACNIDEAQLDGAGIRAAGSGYAKALLWQQGLGSNAFLSGCNAPHWRLFGGALGLTVPARSNTAQTASGGSVGCALRFGRQEQVELHKTWKDQSAAAEKSQRLLTLTCGEPGGDLETWMPRSSNPYVVA